MEGVPAVAQARQLKQADGDLFRLHGLQWRGPLRRRRETVHAPPRPIVWGCALRSPSTFEHCYAGDRPPPSSERRPPPEVFLTVLFGPMAPSSLEPTLMGARSHLQRSRLGTRLSFTGSEGCLAGVPTHTRWWGVGAFPA